MYLWRHALDIFNPREQTPEAEALCRGYEKHQLAYEWQQRTLHDGTFAPAIAAVIGRMPRGTKLLLTDRFRYREDSPKPRRYPWRSHTSSSDVFDDRMMWSTGASRSEPKRETANLAVQVPLAMHAARLSPIEIGFHSFTQSRSPSQFTWIHDQSQLLDLRAAAESLKVFSFKVEEPMTCTGFSRGISSMSKYLRVGLRSRQHSGPYHLPSGFLPSPWSA